MKKIPKQEIEELLTIIPRNYPSMDIFYLCDNPLGLCKELDKLCKEQGYEYDLAITDDEVLDSLDIKARKFDFKRSRYNQHSKLYDFVFVSLDLKKIDNIDTFFKKLYPISKNAGKVIFITDLNTDIIELEDLLIEKNYVAVNPISDTFSNYQILSAQKMHGWGN
jgi:hypothetical protein